MQKQFTKTHSYMAKGIAILFLLGYHLFENEALVTSMEVVYDPFSLNGFLTFTNFGNVCVSIFVFLTSFGIATGLLMQEDFSISAAYRQAVKRFSMLMLNFFILYLSVNLLWWYKFDYQSLYGSGKQGILCMITDACGLSMFFNTPTLNETWWYMEIAYLLIFLVPFLTWLVKKIGYPVLLLAFFTPFIVSFHPDIERYLFVAVFGVCAAYGKWMDSLLAMNMKPVLQWMVGIVGLILCVAIRQNYIVHEYYIRLVDAPIALFLIYLAAAVVGSVPILKNVVTFIGKRSMNIYLVHTFFYMSLWQLYIYRFRYAWATFLILLVSCLAYSVLLEWLKKGVKWVIVYFRKTAA